MLRIVIGIFFVLHGLVHLLYLGWANRVFALAPGTPWPAGSWLFSRTISERATRVVTSIALTLSAAGFVMGGIGLLMNAAWWDTLIFEACIVSALTFLLCWSGKPRDLLNQGGLAVVIALAALMMV